MGEKDILLEVLENRVSDLEDEAVRINRNVDSIAKALEDSLEATEALAKGWKEILKTLSSRGF